VKKLVSIFLLLFFIFTCVFYIVFYISFNFFISDNYINNNYRKKFIKNYYLKNVFRLHQAGDARFDFTGSRFKHLKVIFYLPQQDSLSIETKKDLTQEIRKIINGNMDVVYESRQFNYPPPESADDKDLRLLTDSHPRGENILSDTLLLRVFVLGQYQEIPSFAGLVLNDTSIYLFKKPIQNLSGKLNSTDDISTSVLLHEFAHLLGAEHVLNGCILSEKIENTAHAKAEFKKNYCPEDLEEIKRALGE